MRIGRDLNNIGQPVTADSIRSNIESQLGQLLSPIVERVADRGEPTDERWYWAVPLLLDMEYGGAEVARWFEQTDLPRVWSGEKVAGEHDAPDGWAPHVELAKQMA